MAGKKVKIPMPDGTSVDGTQVDVDESTERWSEYSLSDGSRIKLKQLLMEVTRVEGQWDPEGNPMYFLKAAPAMFVTEAPANLKKKKPS